MLAILGETHEKVPHRQYSKLRTRGWNRLLGLSGYGGLPKEEGDGMQRVGTDKEREGDWMYGYHGWCVSKHYNINNFWFVDVFYCDGIHWCLWRWMFKF